MATGNVVYTLQNNKLAGIILSCNTGIRDPEGHIFRSEFLLFVLSSKAVKTLGTLRASTEGTLLTSFTFLGLFGFFSFPNHYPSDRRELRWNLMLRIGSAAFAKKLRQAREPLAGMSLVCLVCLVSRVSLVYLVYLVFLVYRVSLV
jgi:hypothetical protein